MSESCEGHYYVVNGVKYDRRFPEEWATNHLSFSDGHPDYTLHTGPENCGNCSCYGSLRGVFVGYCSNCSREYNYERGGGFDLDYTQEEMWEKLSYMKGVPLNQVGILHTTDAEEEPEYFLKRKLEKKPKQLKKGAQRKIRRALRERRCNDEYVGMPLEDAPVYRFEMYEFLIIIFILVLIKFSIYLI